MKIVYGSSSSSGTSPRTVGYVETSSNQEHGRLLDAKGQVLFRLVDHSEIKFGFQSTNGDT